MTEPSHTNLEQQDGGKVRPSGFSLVKSFGCAFEGIARTSHERNFRIESAVGVLAVVLGFALGISPTEWLAVIICIALVLALECVNDAIEAVVDMVSPEWHPLAKKAKDAVAGAALIASLASLAVGIVVFLPRLLALLGL
ncbi:MAG: diacylglycerol kinase family protein [Coriobacteriia bacterium]|nr:diacylglycerol kinase family protein [Coriobacteriia bacterium]